ncbi:MAG: 6-phosphogluconolactonase [Thiobacillaceae bacterium]
MTGATSKTWRVFPDSETLATELSQAILAEARACIGQRGRFMLVLAGGTTPHLVYSRLAHANTDWSLWHVWFGDERCYRFGHPERNDTMARTALLQRVPIPGRNVHPISGAGWGPEAAARSYAEVLPKGAFDLTLLGLGEDGHTASLFPGNEWGESELSPTVLPVRNAPKLPAERVSLSAFRLSKSRKVIFIVTGAGKADAVARWKNGDAIPASSIHAPQMEVWLDQAAAG